MKTPVKSIKTLGFIVAGMLVMRSEPATAQSQIYNFITLGGQGPGGRGTVDGFGTNAQFSNPTGVTVDLRGIIYVADEENHTIRKLTPAGFWVSSTIAGLPLVEGSIDGTNNACRFSYPSGVAVDTAGGVYVAETGNSTIRKLMAVGTNWISTTIAGLATVGGETADGTNSDIRFSHPFSIALDHVGNVYVSDSGNNTIRKLTQFGTNWVSSTIAGLATHRGSADGTNDSILFDEPTGIALDSAGDIYVADSYNSTIRKLTPVGTNWVSRTIAGLAGNIGSADGTNSDVRFNNPYGVAVDRGGNVYVADTGNCTIRELTPVGTNWISSTIGGLAIFRAHVDGIGNAARFFYPYGVAIDSVGNLYIADSSNNMIREGVAVAPIFQTITYASGLVTFTWSAIPGQTYQLQYNPDLSSTDWIDLGGTIEATNTLMSNTDSIGPDAKRFYRIALLP